MKQKEKKARNRRTNEQIDKEVISELEKLVAEYGFGNVNLSALMKAANIEANVFYRRYGSMDNLYDRLAKQYDFWINDAIDVSSLNILGPKKFFAETFKTLYRNLSDNILRNLERLFTNATEYAYANPKVGYLVVIFLLLVWLVGLIFDWKWTYARPGSWGGNFFLDLLGPIGFRFWLGVIIMIAIVASAYLYFRVK